MESESGSVAIIIEWSGRSLRFWLGSDGVHVAHPSASTFFRPVPKTRGWVLRLM